MKRLTVRGQQYEVELAMASRLRRKWADRQPKARATTTALPSGVVKESTLTLDVPLASPTGVKPSPLNQRPEWTPSSGKRWQPLTPFSPLTQMPTPIPDQTPPGDPRGQGPREQSGPHPGPQQQQPPQSDEGLVRHPTTPCTRLLIWMPSGVKISVDLVLESDVMSPDEIAAARAAKRRQKNMSADRHDEAEQYYTTAAENAAKVKKRALEKLERAEAKRLEKRDR